MRRLIHHQPQLADQIEVYSMNAIGERLYRRLFGVLKIAPREVIADLISQASKKVENHRFSDAFIMTEWEQVVDAWQLNTWEEYQNVLRLGRKIRLPEDRRKVLWSIFEIIRKALEDVGHLTYASMFERLTLHYKADNRSPFDFIVVDESQDISIAQLKLLGALAENQPDSLFFAGDLGQRIFQQPFSWKVLGVDIRGRSQTLRINYRTSHQIRMFADKLLDPEISDVDGNIESRAGTISVFNGPIPVIKTFASEEKEIDAVKEQVQRWIEDGLALHEIGIFVRSEKELRRAKLPVESLEHPYNVLDEMVSITEGFLSISTMHLAKGLEFRAVIVMACDDEVIPLQERIEMVADESDLLEVYNTERHLLYVACTRARDHLLLTGLEPVSEFLDDLRM